jgi:hypothetical protein
VRAADDASNGLQERPPGNWALHDTGGIRPRKIGHFMAGAVISLGLSTAAVSTGSPMLPISEPIISLTDESSRLKGRPTQGQNYVARRLDAMLMRAEDPAFRREYPMYPTTRSIETARMLAEALVSETTPTPSVVPGDGGVVELVWYKAGWDLMVVVGEGGTELWAHHRSSDETIVRGDFAEQFANFEPILASLPIQ